MKRYIRMKDGEFIDTIETINKNVISNNKNYKDQWSRQVHGYKVRKYKGYYEAIGYTDPECTRKSFEPYTLLDIEIAEIDIESDDITDLIKDGDLIRGDWDDLLITQVKERYVPTPISNSTKVRIVYDPCGTTEYLYNMKTDILQIYVPNEQGFKLVAYKDVDINNWRVL